MLSVSPGERAYLNVIRIDASEFLRSALLNTPHAKFLQMRITIQATFFPHARFPSRGCSVSAAFFKDALPFS